MSVYGWLKNTLKEYFGEQRIAKPAIIFVSTLTLVTLFLWRLHLGPVIYRPVFYIGAVIGVLVGYYLTKGSYSKILLIVSALIGGTLLLVYAVCVDTFTEVTLPTSVLLFLLYCGGLGAVFSALRILMNLGLH